MSSRATVQSPVAYWTTNVTQQAVGLKLQPQTSRESAAGLSPVNLQFQDGNALRAVPTVELPRVLSGDASSQNATNVKAALQATLDASPSAQLPAGTYAINSALVLKPWARVKGDARAEYVAALNESVGGTRIIQTAAAFAISTNIGPDDNASYPGHIVIQDVTLLGGTSAAQTGTYGVRATSSNSMTLERVKAEWFTLSGIRFTGSLLPTIDNCEANYNQDSGIRLDLGALGTAETSNSYGARITNCKIHQNKDAGIRLGDSTVRVSIRDCDIESTGNYFPTGLGYGIYIAGESRTVLIDACWFEGNKRHIVVGAGNSVTTVPKNTRITDCQFWSTNGGGAKIVLAAGRDTIIENCEFLSGGVISLGPFADNPVIRNCFGNPTVVDTNGNDVAIDSKDMTNNFPTVDITSWTKTNCTVAEEFVEGPAGPVPVYKVTPSATGFVRLSSPEVPMSFLTARQTIGCYIRTDGANTRVFDWSVASTTMSKVYTDSTIDNFRVGARWAWASIGRHIDFSDTGNQAVHLSVTVTTTDPFYLTGFSSRSGICYEPFRVQPAGGGVVALANSATPSVYGLRACRTGGTTAITNLTGGALAQVVTIFADHAITITDGANIVLAASANFSMNPTDTLTLQRRSDGKWYEVARSDNS